MSIFFPENTETVGIQLHLVPDESGRTEFKDIVVNELKKYLSTKKRVRKVEVYGGAIRVTYGGASYWINLGTDSQCVKDKLSARNHHWYLLTNKYRDRFTSYLNYFYLSGLFSRGKKFEKPETFYFIVPSELMKYLENSCKIDLTSLDWESIINE